MIFRKGGTLKQNLHFNYGDHELEIVSKFTYLGQALKAIFTLNKYIRKFVNLKPKHVLDLFDKLIRPIFNYSCEVWAFTRSMIIERIHLQFCKKKLLGDKQCAQHDFVYGRTSLSVDRHVRIIKCWLKICNANRILVSIYGIFKFSPQTLNIIQITLIGRQQLEICYRS